MKQKIEWVYVYLNLWRTFAIYISLKHCKFKKKFMQDLKAWENVEVMVKNKNDFISFSYLIVQRKHFRNLMLNRLHRNPIKYIFSRLLFKPLDSLYINMPPENIGGGLYIQHGFSTIIAAQSIGENCSINQQVTIGYKKDKSPTICNNVKICAGAIVIGGITINDNCIVGAGSVVTHDVQKDTVVCGVPAKKIKERRVS